MTSLAQERLDRARMGYVEWETGRRPDGTGGGTGQTIDKDSAWWVGVAVDLVATGAKPDWSGVKAWLAAIQGAACGCIVAPFEIARLTCEIARLAPGSARLTLFIERARLDNLAAVRTQGFDALVATIGAPFLPNTFSWPAGWLPPPVLMSAGQADAAPAPASPPPDTLPLVGIIDDGIAFLNKRFCNRTGAGFTTRFQAVWLQAELFDKTAGRSLDVPFGTVLDAGTMNRRLAAGRPEADDYRDLNALLYPLPVQQATNTRAAHGTHVLDLAAGEDPGTGGAPLIAVQLAPGSVWDTSGRRSEFLVVLALRWIVARALGLGDDPRDPLATPAPRDLVVNLSLGSLAGPGDDTNFLASSIRQEIDLFHRLTTRQMRVVIAYGNSWRSDLVAEARLKKGRPRTLDWRIPPDGHSSSYLELRVPEGQAPSITLTLTPPGGGLKPVVWKFAKPSKEPLKGAGGGVCSQIMPLPPESGVKGVLIAVAPTAGFLPGQRDLAPAGAWKITLETGGKDCLATLRVQRNETPVGYRPYGRQSRLADAGIAGRDPEMRDHSLPEKASAVTRQGTANACAGLADMASGGGGVYFVGAARPDPGALDWAANRADGAVPSSYTSQGRAGPPKRDLPGLGLRTQSAGPTLAAFADTGQMLGGVRATPVLSGARSLRISGTSVAAGLVTRRVAGVLSQSPAPQDEVQAVLGANPAGGRDSRLGFGTLPP
ncbi:MAG: hypothetical protein QM656_06020 [Paracoccaceae bacterium]